MRHSSVCWINMLLPIKFYFHLLLKAFCVDFFCSSHILMSIIYWKTHSNIQTLLLFWHRIECVLVCVWSSSVVCLLVRYCQGSRFPSVFMCVWLLVLSAGSDWIGLKMTFLPLLWWSQLNTVCREPRWFVCVCECVSIHSQLHNLSIDTHSFF